MVTTMKFFKLLPAYGCIFCGKLGCNGGPSCSEYVPPPDDK